jgi:hypothetical protein
MHNSRVLLLAKKAGYFRIVKPCNLGYAPLFLKAVSHSIQNIHNVNYIPPNVLRMTPHLLTKCVLYMSHRLPSFL